MLTDKVKALAINEGADLVGIAPVERFKNAPLRMSPQGILPTAKSVFVVAIHHPDAIIELLAPAHTYNSRCYSFTGWMSEGLDHIAFCLARFFEKEGHTAIPIASTHMWREKPYKDLEVENAPDLSHIHAAVAAGLGEFGWNGLLLTPEYGPRQRVISIITDALLEPTPMYDGPSLCDKCMRCVKACPVNTFTKEVKGVKRVEIGGRTFEYLAINKWRCSWEHSFDIDWKAPVPEVISPEVLVEAHARYKSKGGCVGYCLQYCLPPHLRCQDADYCAVSRRKKFALPIDMSGIERRSLADNIKAIAFGSGADLVGIASLDDFEKLGVKPKDYLPDASSVVVIAVHFQPDKLESEEEESAKENSFYRVAGTVGLRVGFIELEIMKYLERLGYSAIARTELPDDFAAITAGLAKSDAEDNVVTEEYGMYQRFTSIITSAPLLSKSKLSQEIKTKKVLKIKPRTITSVNLKAFSIERGADLVGITSPERLQKTIDILRDEARKDQPYFVARDKNRLPFNRGNFIPEVRKELIKIKSPQDYLSTVRSVVVMGVHYPDGSLDRAIKPPAESVGIYASTQYVLLRELGLIALDVCRFLEDSGYRAIPTGDLCGYASKVFAPTGHLGGLLYDMTANRFAAIAAGLGELGWHGAVLTPEYGIRQRFVSIVTDAELEPDPLYQGSSLCRRCFRCVEACPVGALSKTNKVSLKIGDKSFAYGRCDRLRCDWAKRYGLVGEEGPKYMGSETDILPPREITPQALSEALKKLDPLLKAHLYIVERCLAACPAHLKNMEEENGKTSSC